MNATRPAPDPSVPDTYRHHQRTIEAGPLLELRSGSLKWSAIRRPGSPLPAGLEEETRTFVRGEVESGRLDIAGQSGFVMLHLADANGRPDSVALLLVSTWRGANELWESVYAKPLDPPGEYRRVPKGDHAATYCVWELGVVWHERQAWSRYLDSARDAAAERAYLADTFSGIV
jgi:hypothetical protein